MPEAVIRGPIILEGWGTQLPNGIQRKSIYVKWKQIKGFNSFDYSWSKRLHKNRTHENMFCNHWVWRKTGSDIQ